MRTRLMYTFGAFLAVGVLFMSAGTAHAADEGGVGGDVYEEEPNEGCVNPDVVQLARSAAALPGQTDDECTEVKDDSKVLPSPATPQAEVLGSSATQPSALALTGGDVAGLVAIGTVSIALGGAFVLYRRRYAA